MDGGEFRYTADYYRGRAEEILKLASTSRSEEFRSMLMGLAQQYRRLANAVEQRHAQKRARAERLPFLDRFFPDDGKAPPEDKD